MVIDAGSIGVIAETAVLANTVEGVPDPVLFVGLALFVLLIGGFFAVVELREPLARARTYFSMQPFHPQAATDEGAPVAVRGTIQEADGTVSGPVTGEECVAYGHKEQSYQFGYKHDREKRRKLRRMSNVDDERADAKTWSWNTGSADEEYVPFHVVTEHGPVAVDPEGADLELPVQVDDKTSLPGRIAYVVHPFTGNTIPLAGLFGRLPFTEYVTPGRPRREVERHVGPGDEVLVVGDADGQRSAESNLVGSVSDGGDVDVFRITTRSPLGLKFQSALEVLRSSFVLLVTLAFAAVVLLAGWYQGAFS